MVIPGIDKGSEIDGEEIWKWTEEKGKDKKMVGKMYGSGLNEPLEIEENGNGKGLST